MFDPQGGESLAGLARDALVMLAIGIALGLAYNWIGLESRPPRGLAWIATETPLPSVESVWSDSAQTSAGSPLAALASPAPPAAAPGTPAPGAPTSKPTAGGTTPSPAPARASQATTQQPAAKKPSAQATPAGPFKIELATLKNLVDSRGVMLVDAREPAEFAAGHIPGAINIPYEDVGNQWNRLLQLDPQGKPIVVYCSGGTCESSRMLADLLVKEFKKPNVLVYEGGFPEWVAAGHPVAKGG